MIALLAVSAAIAACDTKGSALSIDQCQLTESMALQPPPNCEKQITQFDMNVCSFRDYLRADIELNRQWDAIKVRLNGAGKDYAMMLAGQKAWLTYRDKQCAFLVGLV